MRRLLPLALLLLALPVRAEAPKVVATIQPLHSLVAAVMQGVGEPALLVPAGASEHTYSMRPSDARALAEARLVVWIGETLEAFAVKPIRQLGKSARVLKVAALPGLTLLDAREGGVWEKHEHAHGHRHGKAALDPHLWLDPGNAQAVVAAVAAELGRLDAANATAYARNAEAARQRLAALDQEIAATLRPIAAQPFVVFHDAYQYLERRYGLNAAGSILVDPERRPSAQRIQRLRERIRTADARCVFAEPQFEPALATTVIEGTGAALGALDGLGAALPPGPQAYSQMMHALAQELVRCLGRS